MEAVGFIGDQIKGVAKSGKHLFDRLLNRPNNSTRRNPIEILKRLQREAFSDIMKLRDRQDKVERILTFSKTSKGSPFQEASTRVRGEVDALGAILLLGNIDQEHYDLVSRAGIRTGIHSRFAFETTVRENDTLLAELVTNQNSTLYGYGYGDDVSGSALSLSKVLYNTDICNWFSATAIPIGAQCRDFGINSSSSNQREGLTDLSFVGPPLLNEHNGSSIGLTVKKSNVIASIAPSISRFGVDSFFSTFGQIVCQLPGGVKLSVLGLHRVPKPSGDRINFGSLAVPFVCFKRNETRAAVIESPALHLQTGSIGSIALKLESEWDEDTKIGGWVEMKNSGVKQLQWGFNLYDDSEDESGWGMSVSGKAEGLISWSHLQVESYLKLNLGKKFNLKPGIVCAIDGNSKIVGLMLRSNWSF